MSTEKTINSIMWGAHHRSVRNEHGDDVLLVIKPLMLRDRNFVEFVYDQALEESESLGIMTEFELKSRLKKKGIWDENHDKVIDNTVERLKELSESLKDFDSSSRQYRMTKSLIKSHETTLAKELDTRANLFHVTAEQYATDARTNAIVYCCTHDEFENRFWKSWNDFQKEVDSRFIRDVVIEINKLPNYEVKDVRKIARASEWRYLWLSSKGNINSLFNRSVGDMDNDQRNLVYWSQVYDSVFEAYERPSDDVIENDEKLDEWFEEQSKKRKNEAVDKGGSVGGVKLSPKMRGHGEVFIVANPAMNPDSKFRQEAPRVPDIQDIEGMNTSFVRTFKRKEQEIIKEKGQIREKDLRSRHNKIARKIIGSSDAVMGKKGIGRHMAKKDIHPGGTI